MLNNIFDFDSVFTKTLEKYIKEKMEEISGEWVVVKLKPKSIKTNIYYPFYSSYDGYRILDGTLYKLEQIIYDEIGIRDEFENKLNSFNHLSDFRYILYDNKQTTLPKINIYYIEDIGEQYKIGTIFLKELNIKHDYPYKIGDDCLYTVLDSFFLQLLDANEVDINNLIIRTFPQNPLSIFIEKCWAEKEKVCPYNKKKMKMNYRNLLTNDQNYFCYSIYEGYIERTLSNGLNIVTNIISEIAGGQSNGNR